jgi:hypothetical protein
MRRFSTITTSGGSNTTLIFTEGRANARVVADLTYRCQMLDAGRVLLDWVSRSVDMGWETSMHAADQKFWHARTNPSGHRTQDTGHRRQGELACSVLSGQDNAHVHHTTHQPSGFSDSSDFSALSN